MSTDAGSSGWTSTLDQTIRRDYESYNNYEPSCVRDCVGFCTGFPAASPIVPWQAALISWELHDEICAPPELARCNSFVDVIFASCGQIVQITRLGLIQSAGQSQPASTLQLHLANEPATASQPGQLER